MAFGRSERCLGFLPAATGIDKGMAPDKPEPGKDRGGGTSQDRPGDAEPSGGAGDAGRGSHDPTRPEDSNEKADDRVGIIEPDGDPSPRA